MIYTIAKQTTFTPEWNDNRLLPEGEQIKITIGFPSVAEIAEQASTIENSALFNFKIYVKDITGFKIEVNGKTIEATVDDIINQPGLSELFTEIKAEVDKLTVIDKKK